MPDFYEKMKNRLRTAEQGADTATWLAISDAALKQPSGLFFQGKQYVTCFFDQDTYTISTIQIANLLQSIFRLHGHILQRKNMKNS